MITPDKMTSFARAKCRSAFSLIEVTLSIGIIAFALITVVALLPVGLQANKNSADQARAIAAMNSIAFAIQNAVIYSAPPASTQYKYKAAQPFGTPSTDTSNNNLFLYWYVNTGHSTVARAPSTLNVYLDENGIPFKPKSNTASDKAVAAMLAYVLLTPPSNMQSAGQAYIGVTWDKRVITAPNGWTDGASTGSAGNPGALPLQRNYVETVIYFTPK
jgi:uncharacterized protein (TIGR02598 family)